MGRRRGIVLTGLIGGLVALGVVWILAGWLPTRGIESPGYTVVREAEGYEVRRYDPYLVAEVEVAGGYKEALNQGFRILFQYISGENTGAEKISMTAPVLQEREGKKIAMTAPVLQEEEEGAYRIAFVVPSRYTPGSVPRPTDPRVRIREVAGEETAVLRFSGYATEERAAAKRAQLARLLERDGLRPTTELRLAQYNPPWTPPFMRRNEIIAGVE